MSGPGNIQVKASRKVAAPVRANAGASSTVAGRRVIVSIPSEAKCCTAEGVEAPEMESSDKNDPRKNDPSPIFPPMDIPGKDSPARSASTPPRPVEAQKIGGPSFHPQPCAFHTLRKNVSAHLNP